MLSKKHSEPSNLVILEKINNLYDKFQTFCEENKDEHREIIAHQKETNGRVNGLELWKSSIEGYLGGLKLAGGAAGYLVKFLYALIGGLVSLVGYSLIT